MIQIKISQIFPLLAAAIISFRKENLLLANNLHHVEAILADISSLPVVPLLQLALERNYLTVARK